MTNYRRATIAAVILLIPLVAATAGFPDYFPLSIGNSWTYYEFGIEHFKHTVAITDTLRIDGELFYDYGGTFIRKDSLGRIWKHINGRQLLWFDFTISEADSYFYQESESDFQYIVQIHKSLKKWIVPTFISLDSCILLTFNVPSIVDVDKSYIFASSIGIVNKSGGMGITYLLESATIDGNVISDVEIRGKAAPSRIFIKQNYPNPFNPSTSITYELPHDGFVVLKIYDITGRLVRVLVRSQKLAGAHPVLWDGLDDAGHKVAAGVYLYRIEFVDAAGEKVVFTRKMSLVK